MSEAGGGRRGTGVPMGYELLEDAPRSMAELARYFARLSVVELDRVWVAAVIDAIAGDVPGYGVGGGRSGDGERRVDVRDLAMALDAVRVRMRTGESAGPDAGTGDGAGVCGAFGDVRATSAAMAKQSGRGGRGGRRRRVAVVDMPALRVRMVADLAVVGDAAPGNYWIPDDVPSTDRGLWSSAIRRVATTDYRFAWERRTERGGAYARLCPHWVRRVAL